MALGVGRTVIDLFMNNEVRRLEYQEPVAVIGDIHGRSDLLAALFAQLPDMPIIVMGDLCDRGTDTAGVIDLLLERHAVGVRGNHEDWLIQWLEGRGFDDFAFHPQVGGIATLKSYGVTARTPREIEQERFRVPPEHRAFFNDLALVLDLTVCGERYWAVHAGLPPRKEMAQLPLEEVVPWLAAHHPTDLIWGVTQPEDVPPVDRTVIMGHVALNDPLDTGTLLAVDTGAGALGRAGRLTAVVLPQRNFVTVGAQHARAVTGRLEI